MTRTSHRTLRSIQPCLFWFALITCHARGAFSGVSDSPAGRILSDESEQRVFNACDTRGFAQISSRERANEVVHVVTASDHNVESVKGLRVFVATLFASSRRPDLITLTIATTPDFVQTCQQEFWIFGNVTVVPFVVPPGMHVGLRAHGYRSDELSNAFNFARFFLPSFTQADKVLYADPDVVWLADVVPLVQSALRASDLPIASRQFNCTISSAAHCASHFFLFDRMDSGLAARVSRDAHIFNAGFFVTSLQHWRRHRVTEQLLSWAMLNSINHFYVGGSQPPMLLVFPRFERLPDAHNIPTPYLTECPDIELRAHSVHYVGPAKQKPWNAPHEPHAKAYQRALVLIRKRFPHFG